MRICTILKGLRLVFHNLIESRLLVYLFSDLEDFGLRTQIDAYSSDRSFFFKNGATLKIHTNNFEENVALLMLWYDHDDLRKNPFGFHMSSILIH